MNLIVRIDFLDKDFDPMGLSPPDITEVAALSSFPCLVLLDNRLSHFSFKSSQT